MRLTRRGVIGAGVALAGGPALAQGDFPTRAIRIIVPSAPGGSLDILSRLIARHLGERRGWQVVVENRSGGGGNIGFDAVAKSRPDGCTILIASEPLTVNPSLYANLPFDPLRDLAPLTMIATLSQVLVVHPSVPAQSFRDFVELARSRRMEINIGSAGTASPGHMAVAQLVHAGVPLTHMPYRGGGPAVQDTVAGNVQGGIMTLPAALPFMRIGTEGENLTAGFRRLLHELLEGNAVEDVSFDMEVVRMVKTPEEIARLRRATEITVKAHASFRAAIRPGNTDEDLHKAACIRMLTEGASAVNFINIAAGPANSFAAHAPFPRGHVLRHGDFVKVDMGAQVKGYSADFVRSYFLGEASARQQEIWKRLNEVQVELGLWLKPGVTGGEIFERGYGHISRYLNNFPREFLGHGIGLGSHEQPRMNRANRTALEPDSVVCIEYSYYHDGVRHHTEDTFLVTADRVEHWTADCPRELIVRR